MDVKTTFLNGDLDEEVYTNQPHGFIMPSNKDKIKHESNGITISLSHYIKKVLKKFNYFDCTLLSTPMDTSEKLMPNNGQSVSQIEYSRVIGCLMYAMTCTRPSITFAVSKLSSIAHTSNLGTQHWQAIQRISNSKDNSSTSGWVFLLGGGAISWVSKKQTCITGLTMKSEFMALAVADKEAEWFNNEILSFINILLSPSVQLTVLAVVPWKQTGVAGKSKADELENFMQQSHAEVNKAAGTQLRSSPKVSTSSPLVSLSTTISLPRELNSIDVAATFGVPLTTVGDLHKLINDIDAGSIRNSIKVDRNNADMIPFFKEDGIILNATFIGKPVMLDSNTSFMCNESWGRSSFSRCLIEVNSEADLMDVVTTGIPSLSGDGFTKETIRVEYEWRLPRCDICEIFGHFMTIALKRWKGKSKSTNGGQFTGPSVKQNVRYEPKETTSAPKKGATYVGNTSQSSSMLKTTGNSSKKDNLSMSNSFSTLNDKEDDDEEDVENVYDESANLIQNTKAGGSLSFTAAAG
ncbi:hypothetical protein Tco_0323987 [Tanacetum coccineum]